MESIQKAPWPLGRAAGEPPSIDVGQLHAMLCDGGELALFDVREAGQFGEGHIFHAVPLPFSQLELEVTRLAPRRTVRMVLVDDDGSVARRATERLLAQGYTDVRLLSGGNQAWVAAGRALFPGIHVPSKAFGELVEHIYETPDMSAQDLAKLVASDNEVVILDGRPFEEYQKMSIPGATCCPNGELGLWVKDLVPDERTTIVVNCAGRTRSIIGAQTLRDLGLKNPIFALRNGTMGWLLDGLKLAHASDRTHPAGRDPEYLAQAKEAAQALARQHGVVALDSAAFERWREDESRTTFLLDVRTSVEYASGTHPGAQHAPGGQLLQYTDRYLGVRHGRAVLLDTDGVRAPIVASWLRRMGWDTVVLAEAVADAKPSGALLSGLSLLPEIPASDLVALIREGAVAVVDLRPSMSYRTAHIPGAAWSIRPRIAHQLQTEGRPIVFVSDDPVVAGMAAMELSPGQQKQARRLERGMSAWHELGFPVVSTPATPPDRDCIDFLFFVHDRHDGNFQAARDYLSWETGLLARLEGYESATFRLPLG